MKLSTPPPFALRLRELREAAGLSQLALASGAGCTQGAIGHWERGIREPTWSAVVRLAGVLGVSVLAFLEPVVGEAPKRGRLAGPVVEKVKKQRGRPRKGAG